MPATEVGLLAQGEFLLGPMWAALVLHEFPNAYQFVGGALILGAVLAHEIHALMYKQGALEDGTSDSKEKDDAI